MKKRKEKKRENLQLTCWLHVTHANISCSLEAIGAPGAYIEEGEEEGEEEEDEEALSALSSLPLPLLCTLAPLPLPPVEEGLLGRGARRAHCHRPNTADSTYFVYL
jgi:hypothetical protein